MRNIFLGIFLLFSLSSTCQTNSGTSVKNTQLDSEKILIVYLSRTKNTQAVAEMIWQEVGGDLVELELVNPYPEDYQAIVAQVARENETGFLPLLKTKVDILKYDSIFLGFPSWGIRLPPPMRSFLHENDLSGKTVIPFNTHAGYGSGSSFQQVEELCSRSRILPGFSVKGGIERDGVLIVMEGKKQVEVLKEVKRWLKKIGIHQKLLPKLIPPKMGINVHSSLLPMGALKKGV